MLACLQRDTRQCCDILYVGNRPLLKVWRDFDVCMSPKRCKTKEVLLWSNNAVPAVSCLIVLFVLVDDCQPEQRVIQSSN